MTAIQYVHTWTPGSYDQSLLDNLIAALGAQTGQSPVDTAVQLSPDGSTAFITVDDSIAEATVIAAISRSAQLITAGELRLGNFPAQPGSGLFSGVRIGYPAFEYPAGSGQFYHIVGVNNDVIMVGLDAATGKLLAAAGAMIVDNLGITTTGINYFIRFNVENGGTMRRLEFLTLLLASGALAGCLNWYDPSAGSNLQTNGDFELGNLNDWTAADSGAPAWSADSAAPHGGTYAARFNTTGDTEGGNLQTNGDFETGSFTGWTTGGTGTWATPTYVSEGWSPIDPSWGTYLGKVLCAASQTGTLTTNLGGTPRMAVTAGLTYRAIALAASALPTHWTTHNMLIKWYDATSGGSLISTTTLTLSIGAQSGTNINYISNVNNVVAPAGAVGAEIVLNIVKNSTVESLSLRFDNISFTQVQSGTLTTNLGATPRMAVTAGNSYSFSSFAKSDNAATTWTNLRALIKWYTATSGGSLVSTDTIPLTPGSGYVSNARTLIAPATAAGAEIVLDLLRGASGQGTTNLYFDDIIFQAVSTNTGIRFQPNVTVFGGPLDMEEIAAPSAPASGIRSIYHNSAYQTRTVDNLGQDGQLLDGERSGYAVYSNDAAAKTILSKVIKANRLGSNGTMTAHCVLRLINGASGAARNITIIASFGGTTLFSYSPGGNTPVNTSTVVEFWTTITNANSVSSQVATFLGFNIWGITPGTTPTVFAGLNQLVQGVNPVSVTTSSDQTLLITGTMSIANAALSFEVLKAEISGPTNA